MGNAAASAGAEGPLTGLRAGWSSGRRRRAVGTARSFQGLRADWEQQTPPSTPPGPQFLSRNYEPDGSAGWLCRSAPRQVDDSTTRPSGSGPTRQSDARNSEPSYFAPIDRPGSGRVEPNDLYRIHFYVTLAYLHSERSIIRIGKKDVFSSQRHLR